MGKLNGMVIDDTLVYRKVLSSILEETGLCRVVKSVASPIIALEWLEKLDIDIVLLDFHMPEMNGIDVLKIIKRDYPQIEVIMVSSGGEDSANLTLEALNNGALDFILKPQSTDIEKNKKQIFNTIKILLSQIAIKKSRVENKFLDNETKVKAEKIIDHRDVKNEKELNKIYKDMRERNMTLTKKIKTTKIIKKTKWHLPDLILIASSTGGPAALDSLFSNIDYFINRPIFIVQHMPKNFTNMLAKSLNNKNKYLNIVEASDNEDIIPGNVYIAPGGFHMVVENNKIKIIDGELINGVKPAADILFKSIAENYSNKKILSIILTGMGSDGLLGVKLLKEKTNCYSITQDEKSSVVYGMPRMVYENNLSDEELSIDLIYKRLKNITLS